MSQIEIHIRPFQSTDGSAVRRIAWETAEKGRPGERLFPDRELLTDLIMRYHTDFEPGSAFVAEHAGQVVGYVTGCLDTRRFLRFMAWRIVPAALWSALRRGSLLGPRMRQLARLNLRELLPTRRNLPYHDYPAHLHVNLDASFRGRGLGRQLAERFMERARAAGATGIHASVREDNLPAQQFFQRLGFSMILRRRFLQVDETPTGVLYCVVFGKHLSHVS